MPRFVILEHQWKGVHWDLMLERGEALRTWALDAPIRPGADLTARSLADHRRAYLDHEGPVSGGRGSVRRWDEGRYEVVAWGEDRVEVVLEGRQIRGVVEGRRSETGPAEGAEGWVFRLRPNVA